MKLQKSRNDIAVPSFILPGAPKVLFPPFNAENIADLRRNYDRAESVNSFVGEKA